VRTDRNSICQRGHGGPRSLRVVIRDNLLEDIGGDGIKTWGSNGALIEHNVIHGGRMRARDAAAGIWPFDCDDTLIQFNEVSGMKGVHDGQGFDSDYLCRRSVFQYNYSHDNEGGFMLVCSPGSSYCEDTVIRYNISQNDGINDARVFQFAGSPQRTRAYNNTIFIGPHQQLPMIQAGEWEGGKPGEFTFANNLFIVEGRVTYQLDKASKYLFENNVFLGTHEKRPNDARALTTMPPLLAPGSAKDGFASLGGYRPRSSKPWPTGVVIPANGGRDFFGAPVPASSPPSIGAVQPQCAPQATRKPRDWKPLRREGRGRSVAVVPQYVFGALAWFGQHWLGCFSNAVAFFPQVPSLAPSPRPGRSRANS